MTRGRSLVAGAAASAPEGTASFATAAPRLRAKRRSREPGRSDEAIAKRLIVNYEIAALRSQ